MTVISSSVLINRPIEEVFDFTADPRNELQWNPKVRVMQKLTDGPVGAGTHMAAKYTMSGHIELECTQYERPYLWTWENGGPIAVTLTVRQLSTPAHTGWRGSSSPSLSASCGRKKHEMWDTSRPIWSPARQPCRLLTDNGQ